MTATDLFNSTKGQFASYTTLIGGKVPNANDWMLESFSDIANLTILTESFSLTDSGLAPTGSPVSDHSFIINTKNDLKNFVSVLEYKTGDIATDFKIGSIGRYISSSQYLYAQVNNQSKTIDIYKKGTSTPLATNSIASMVENRTYWLVTIFAGDYVRCCHHLEDPRVNPTPSAVVTYLLSAAEATTFNVTSETGVAGFIPIDDSARIISIETGQAFEDAENDIDVVLRQKHVDIRDFINYRYPVRYRNIRELNSFHITEKAFSQVITLNAVPTSGDFNLFFYPSDQAPYVPETFGPFSYDISNDDLKSELNSALNSFERFSVTEDDPVKNVINDLANATPTLTIEFNESFGEIVLMRMSLNDLLPALESEESYDVDTGIGTFAAVVFDQGYIETADPLNEEMTVDDLRIEYKYKNENWILRRGFETTSPPAGTNAPLKTQFRDGDLVIGKISSEENRNGATLHFSRAMKKVGKDWSVYLQSSTKPINCVTIGDDPGKRPNLTDDENLTINIIMGGFPWDVSTNESVIDIYSDYDDARPGCFVQFTSSSDGTFSKDPSMNSLPVAFKDHIHYEGTAPSRVEFIAKLSEFLDQPQFDFTKITGVRIFLAGRMVSTSSSISIMAIRCVDTSITGGKQWLSAETNTLEQAVVDPIPGYDGAVQQIVAMIKGANIDTTGSDPSPVDSNQSIQFRTGKGLSTDFNKLMTFAREVEYDDLYRSSWLTAEYGFVNAEGNEDSYLLRYQTTRVKTDDGLLVLYWDVHPGGVFRNEYTGESGLSFLPVLEAEKNYELSAQFYSNSIKFQINELSSADQPTRMLLDAPLASSEKWTPLAGRIGWYAEFADKDMQMDAFDLDSAGYALLKTKTFVSETPIEGAQLFTVDSGDKNLFERFYTLSSGDNVYIDNQKTTSTEGSFVFESFGSTQYPGLISNEFVVDDWSHMYIEFDIWVPRSLKTDSLRPKMLLRPVEQPEGTSGVDVFSGIIPSTPYAFEFTPGAWTTIYYDLRGTNAKNGNYYLVIASDGDGLADQSVFRNKWWIDNVKINTQTVEWEMRAIENGSWTPFKRNINRQYGALHLSENQTGRYIQLQARALTEDAWIAEYTLMPKYLELGRLV